MTFVVFAKGLPPFIGGIYYILYFLVPIFLGYRLANLVKGAYRVPTHCYGILAGLGVAFCLLCCDYPSGREFKPIEDVVVPFATAAFGGWLGSIWFQYRDSRREERRRFETDGDATLEETKISG